MLLTVCRCVLFSLLVNRLSFCDVIFVSKSYKICMTNMGQFRGSSLKTFSVPFCEAHLGTTQESHFTTKVIDRSILFYSQASFCHLTH